MGRGGAARITRYVRPVGAICYELSVVYGPESAQSTVQRLLESGLAWGWASYAEFGRTPCDPEAFRLTPLTDGGRHELETVLVEGSIVDDDWVTLIGVDHGASEILVDRAGLQSALDRFDAAAVPPVRVVVNQVGDQNFDHVFVAPHPDHGTADLLAAWGIHADTRYRTIRYRWLNTAGLDMQFRRSDSRARQARSE